MPANKNALIRYKTIDACLRNPYRRWTLADLVEACSNALYDAEGITKGVSERTVQGDLQMMRSDKLGYNAPIEVYDHKYYRYADADYSIMQMPLSANDYAVMQEAVDMLCQLGDFEQFADLADTVSRLQEKLAVGQHKRRPAIHFDSVPTLKGLRLLSPLYNHIIHQQTLRLLYQSFEARCPHEYIVYPHLLKEFRNRWFLFATEAGTMRLYNFPLDRIACIAPVDEPYRDNPDFDALHFFDDVVGVSKNIGTHPVRLLFWASREQAHYIRTKPIHPSQQLVSDDAAREGAIFSINVVLNFELYSILMSYGPGLRLLAPRHAVSYLGKQLREAAALYDEQMDY